jgi:hypothetical protein
MDVGIQSAITSLPQRRRWYIHDVPLDFSFHSELRNLAAVLEKHMIGVEEGTPPVVEHASDYIVFGEYDYGEGVAHPLLVVRRSNGNVFRLEVENDVPLIVLNSSLLAFINTFNLLDEYLGNGKQIPADLSSSARNLDPTVYSQSHWHNLVTELFETRG